MIVCFDCSADTKRDLDRLVMTGGHTDYADAIASAISNQALLQARIAREGTVIVGDDSSEHERASKSYSADSIQVRGNDYIPQPEGGKEVNLLKKKAKTVSVPPIFTLNGLPPRPGSFPSLPADAWTGGERPPVDKWIFGQYNRLLPAKASCRALAHLIEGGSAQLAVESTSTMIANEAWELGECLARLDQKYGIPRDESLTTAFPSSDRDANKGCLRFANQFVAGMTTDGQILGLLYQLKLINSSDSEKGKMMLTRAGWDFGILRNPVLDEPDLGPPAKFSAEEKEFLLGHVQSAVVVEDSAYRLILRLVTEGAHSPSQLDQELRTYVTQDTDKPVKDSFISTQRSGAVSRMADLGLLIRSRDGVKVTYVVTERGERYVREVKAPQSEK